MNHGAGQFLALARTAGTVFAAVGQTNVLANTSSQNGFTGHGRERSLTGFDANLKVWGGGFAARHGLGILAHCFIFTKARFCLQTKLLFMHPRQFASARLWVRCPGAFAASGS